MAHEVTSAVFCHGKDAWHGEGTTIEGTRPARELFENYGALFPIEKLQLWAGDPKRPEQMISLAEERVAIWRPDERRILGTAGPGYQIIPTETLLRLAEAVREECDMDSVVVMRHGAKVAFCAKVRSAKASALPGDDIGLNYVGYLGSDGKTGLGAMLTTVRTVCSNTLNYGMRDADRRGQHLRIRHNSFEISQIDSLIEQIDLTRQYLPKVADECQAMQAKAMTTDEFRYFLERTYQLPAVTLASGDTRPGTLDDMPRKGKALLHAWQHGLGSDIQGVQGTAWAAFNAVTEVESSTKTAGNGKRRFHSAMFGNGRSVITRARELALAL